jgi:endonuclease/exonuclease/phosphatase (EEP) superfamily protein YafD
MLETTVRVGGVALQAISLRFDKGNLTNNEAGHRQLVDLINRMNPKVPVVVGGDFNADPNTDHMKDFVARSGLTDVFSKRPDPGICGSADTRIDYIFYRGFDDVVRMEQRCPWETGTEASDHAWVYAEVVGEPPNQEPHILREGGTFYTGDSSRLCLPLPTHV